MKSMRFISVLLAVSLFIICGCSSRTNLADDYFNAGDYERAIIAYKKFIEKHPQSWKAYVRLGECYKNSGEIELALDAYNEALKLNPDLNNIKDNVKELQLQVSEKLISEKSFNKAYKILDKILKTDPDNIEANYILAVLYNETDRPGKAKIHFDKVSKLVPYYREVSKELKLISDRREEAEKYYQKAKELYRYEVYYEAYETFKKAVEQKPDYRDAQYYMHISLGKLYLKKQEVVVLWEAIKEFSNAIEVYPEKAEPHYLMGLTYEKKDKKDYKMPIEEYNRAIELEPDSKIAEMSKERIKRFYKDKKEMEKMEKFWREKRK